MTEIQQTGLSTTQCKDGAVKANEGYVLLCILPGMGTCNGSVAKKIKGSLIHVNEITMLVQKGVTAEGSYKKTVLPLFFHCNLIFPLTQIVFSCFFFFVCILPPSSCFVLPQCYQSAVSVKSLLDSERVHVDICMADDFNGTLCIASWSADLCQKQEEDFVIGKDRMRCNTQQEVFQADSPSLNKVGVKVVC